MSNKAAAVLAGAAVLVGVLIGRASASDHSPSAPKPKTISGQNVDPATYPHRMSGAASAAEAYSEALGRTTLLSAAERRTLVETISTAAASGQILKEQEEADQLTEQTFDLPRDAGQFVVRHAPLGYRFRSYTPDMARVEIWGVGVVGNPASATGRRPASRRRPWSFAGSGQRGVCPVRHRPMMGRPRWRTAQPWPTSSWRT